MNLTLTRKDMETLNQDQKAAVIDALVVAVLADGAASAVEVARFDHEISEVPWELDKNTVVALVRAAREKVGALRGAEEGIALVKGVAEKLPTEEIREKVLRMMMSVMLADGQAAPGEKKIGGVFAAAFQLSPEALKRIGTDAKGDAPATASAGYRWETAVAANVMVEVPTDWSRATRDNVLVVKSPTLHTGLELVAITGGAAEVAADEKKMMAELGKLLTVPLVTRQPKPLEQHGLRGSAFAGTGAKDGHPVEWFALSLGDGKDKGILALGFVDAAHVQDQKEAVIRIMNSIRPAIMGTAANP